MALLAAAVSVAVMADAARAADAPDLAARRRAIEALSPEEKERLRRNFERFEALDPSERQRLRALAERIEQSPQRDELRQALLRYHDWLRRRSSADRTVLATLTPQQRVEWIEQRLAGRRQQPPQRLRREDAQRLRHWLLDYLAGHGEQLRAAAGPAPRFLDSADEEARQAWLAGAVFGGRRGPVPPGLLPSDGELESLAAELSPEAREALAGKDRREKLQLVAQWIGMDRRGGRRQLDREAQMAAIRAEELAEFFEELDLEEKLRLVFLPRPEDFERELKRLYLEEYIVARPPDREPAGRLRNPQRSEPPRGASGRAGD